MGFVDKAGSGNGIKIRFYKDKNIEFFNPFIENFRQINFLLI